MSRADALYERTSLCAQCDRPYEKKRIDQRFCNRACAVAWYAAHPRHPKKKKAVTGGGITGVDPADLIGADVTSARQEPPLGIVHDLIGDQYDVATAERNGHPSPSTCEQCGKAYDRKRPEQRFCGPGCAGAWSSAHPKKERPPAATGPDPQRVLAAVPELPTEPPVALEIPAADLQRVLAKLALEAIGAADAWHLEAWCGPGIHLTLRKEAT